jgi:hypothetical protein
MLQVNLLPDIKKDLLKAKRIRNLVITICTFASIGTAVIVLVLFTWNTGLGIYRGILKGDVEKKIAEIEREKTNNKLGEYLSVQNDLSQISNIKESQPQLSRLMDYLDVIFGRSNHIEGLSWNDWQGIKILTTGGEGASGAPSGSGVGIELTGQVESIKSRLMLRNRLYYAMVKYSEYAPGSSGTVKEGETRTDQKLFPYMISTVDFEGGTPDETTGKYPFKVTLVFNPIVFNVKYRIQGIEIDKCKVWSATYDTSGEGCKNDGSLDSTQDGSGDGVSATREEQVEGGQQ